ncbi:hypothetical protein BCR33DRAFT_233953 [Rhizoclosmatium globosum]|uniref:Uncharacterized protein n=1 Tax=Rhizoclosmatium globosum TaxID=329046 RepID=A0A1Y2CB26_9FUNG|nr:hypothetical protein BCR33DRAFT_233953 [Rhizoclosmatium globosum]|eukprot:ORY44044.1 hypothetical protein BCR33DRAFT_233953 [Rhizoclosmatium globosum]
MDIVNRGFGHYTSFWLKHTIKPILKPSKRVKLITILVGTNDNAPLLPTNTCLSKSTSRICLKSSTQSSCIHLVPRLSLLRHHRFLQMLLIAACGTIPQQLP